MLNLERILQGELDQTWINRRRGNLPECSGGGIQAAGVGELWVIEGVEEFRPEDQRAVFP